MFFDSLAHTCCSYTVCVSGPSTEHIPVQKTVPLIGTPVDADPEQHEVSYG